MCVAVHRLLCVWLSFATTAVVKTAVALHTIMHDDYIMPELRKYARVQRSASQSDTAHKTAADTIIDSKKNDLVLKARPQSAHGN